jgi:beta-lactamase superfamily II metal-dependent hydrolase
MIKTRRTLVLTVVLTLVAVVSFATAPPRSSTFKLHFIDAGQADATLIMDSCGPKEK